MPSLRLAGPLFAACLASSALAADGETVEEIIVTGGRDYRSYSADWLVLTPGTGAVEAALRFLTSGGGPGVEPLHFTDAAMLDLALRYGLKEGGVRGEIFAGASLLPKQPTTLGAGFWQGALLGGRIAFSPDVALALAERAGPQLSAQGFWAETSLLAEYKYEMSDYVRLRLEGGLAATGVGLAPASMAWFGEAVAQLTASIHIPGIWSAWVGAEYRLPVNAPAGLLPQPRLSAKIGTTYSPIAQWDLFAQADYVDRGDAVNPPTTLPILDGGFDEVTLVFGLTRRFALP